MKVLKVFLALVISFLLLCTQGLLMGAFACDRSFSSGSITKAIQDTNFTQELYDTALSTSNKTADEQVQKFLKEALKTNAAAQFMGDYASSAIDSALYGKDYSSFTKEDLTKLAESSLDEMANDSGVSISAAQKQQVLDYVNSNGDAIVKQVNHTLSTAPKEDVTSSSDAAATAQVQAFLGTPIRIILIAVCLILGVILIALFWRSKLGFIWWAVVSFITGGIFLLLGTSSDLLSSYISESGEGTAFSLLFTGMFSHGFTFVGLGAMILTLILIVICLISRKAGSRRIA